jgi:hypothetical protein
METLLKKYKGHEIYKVHTDNETTAWKVKMKNGIHYGDLSKAPDEKIISRGINCIDTVTNYERTIQNKRTRSHYNARN